MECYLNPRQFWELGGGVVRGFEKGVCHMQVQLWKLVVVTTETQALFTIDNVRSVKDGRKARLRQIVSLGKRRKGRVCMTELTISAVAVTSIITRCWNRQTSAIYFSTEGPKCP